MRNGISRTQKPKSSLADRLKGLESRVAELEQRLKAALGRADPLANGAGRRARRCPGCELELPRGVRGTCTWCGFVLGAAVGRSRG